MFSTPAAVKWQDGPSAPVRISTVTAVWLYWGPSLSSLGTLGKSQLEGIPGIWAGEGKPALVEVRGCEQLETQNNLSSTGFEVF